MGKYDEKVKESMEENLGKLGIMDFFNVLFTGGFFVICISWIVPWFWDYYVSINENFEYESYVGVFVLCYVVGIILQELGSWYDSKCEHIKSNVLEYFLQEKVILKEGLIESILKRVRRKEKGTKGKKIIDNPIKLHVYQKYQQEILDKKAKKILKNVSEEEQCRFVYAYCLYYIEHQGKSAKYEKMRGLFDMARTMIVSSILLIIASSINFFYNVIFLREFDGIMVSILQVVLFVCCVFIFHSRAKKLMNYKARMLMEVYDVCQDCNNPDQESLLEIVEKMKEEKKNKKVFQKNIKEKESEETTMCEELTKENTEDTKQELFRNLIAMIAEERCIIEEAREEFETNPSAFMEKLKKGM